ncbi:unnamed protein product [Rotaria sp. Silwood1]|nr:unnamed protein product [Rotaria sp. Silwood1]CAF4919681.1 unnamed protein product [Rotaria sp. Silwood1]
MAHSHKGTDAAQPITLDNIYSTCLQSLNVSTEDGRRKYRLLFNVDETNNGLLKSCGNIPDGCVDDCFFGVSIDNLKPYQRDQQSNSTVSMVSRRKNPTGGGKVKKLSKDKKIKKINNDGKIKND